MKPSKELKPLIQEIAEEVKATGHLTGRSELSKKVMAAISEVPREEFVSDESRLFAYLNQPLPIGFGQTISQPYIVALMTDILDLEKNYTVLEIGTGSGYQTAILSKLVKQVYSIEIITELSERATQRLKQLGYNNIETCVSDGYSGWPEHAPYDAIIVTAAAASIPAPLLKQLKTGGKMIIPVEEKWSGQMLKLVKKEKNGEINVDNILRVVFVPLTRQVR